MASSAFSPEQERLRILSEASRVFAETGLDARAIAQELAVTLSRALRGGAVVGTVESAGDMVMRAVADVDPAVESELREVLGRPLKAEPGTIGAELVAGADARRFGREVVPRLNSALRPIAEKLGLGCLVMAPIRVRGRLFGVVSVWRSAGAPPFVDDDTSLVREIADRAALCLDNTRLFEEARAAIALRDEFLIIAGHELNTPLTPLRLVIDGLRRASLPPDVAAKRLESASRQVARLTRLVSELLDVSRISSGKVRLEPERLDLSELVEDVLARMAEEVQAYGSTVSVLLERPCIGTWDRVRIEQVVVNLISNAAKYGGGKPIDVELESGGRGVILRVRDRGIGIAAADRQRIFDRFERAESVRNYGGFGLGLWITRQIVEASGGTVTVDSEPGKGSTFVVELPR